MSIARRDQVHEYWSRTLGGYLLRAMLLQAFYSVRSERALVQRFGFDLLDVLKNSGGATAVVATSRAADLDRLRADQCNRRRGGSGACHAQQSRRGHEITVAVSRAMPCRRWRDAGLRRHGGCAARSLPRAKGDTHTPSRRRCASSMRRPFATGWSRSFRHDVRLA